MKFHVNADCIGCGLCVSTCPEVFTMTDGGTDGATLSFKGLPCPNLGTGGFNYHGPCEGITVEAMDKATEILLNLADLYKDAQ